MSLVHLFLPTRAFFRKLSALPARRISMSTAAPHSDPISIHNVPVPTPEQLPDDLEALKRMIVELTATLRQERRDKEHLQHRIHLLLQRLYGPRTERINPDQLLLFAEWAATPQDAAAGTANAPPATAAAPAEPTARPKKKTPHGRRKPPDNVRREPVHHQLTEAERLCICGQLRVDIGTEISEQFDWLPASLFVWQHIVHKYLCRDCSKKPAEGAMPSPGHAPEDEARTDATADTSTPAVSAAAKPIGPAIISASKPPPPLAKGLPGAGLLAYIIVSKYFDHLPLYRLERIFARQGATISRSTMCDWMAASARALRPLYELMVSEVLQSQWLHTDDTPVKNQGHQPGTTALSRFWIYWGDRTHPYNVFDFTINRKRDGPQKFLADFHGYLHADAFSGYDALYLPERRGATGEAAPIIEVACNAHARRKFYEARGSDDLRAHLALGYYRSLYELERGATAAGLDDDGRRRMRQEISRHFLDQFHAWLEEQRPQVLPKSPIAEAINYALNNWTALTRYTEAGFLSIDNNIAEREMKRIAIGRKNWLFVGSDQGGQTAAILFSFTSTCHRLGVEPWAYLQDVLTRLPTLPAEHRTEALARLLPDRWHAAQVAAKPATATPQ
jgi:transposase